MAGRVLRLETAVMRHPDQADLVHAHDKGPEPVCRWQAFWAGFARCVSAAPGRHPSNAERRLWAAKACGSTRAPILGLWWIDRRIFKKCAERVDISFSFGIGRACRNSLGSQRLVENARMQGRRNLPPRKRRSRRGEQGITVGGGEPVPAKAGNDGRPACAARVAAGRAELRRWAFWDSL